MDFTPNLVVKIDLELIYPAFRERILGLVANCHDLGADYYATSGLRSWKEQEKIYAQGRTIKCPGCAKNPCGHVISNAPPGWSAHNYGIAVDFARDKDLKKMGLQPDWDLKAYELLAVEAEKLGLEAGQHWAKFKDAPHIQMPLTKLGIKWPTLIKLYNEGQMRAVWSYLDKFKW